MSNKTLYGDIPKGLCAYGDKNMISTTILNLITNAIKFTPEDGTIEIRAAAKENEVEVMVADTGVGISAKNLEKLFRLD